jgi:hypothetical protein
VGWEDGGRTQRELWGYEVKRVGFMAHIYIYIYGDGLVQLIFSKLDVMLISCLTSGCMSL